MAQSASNKYRLRMQSLTKRSADRDGERWEDKDEKIILANLDKTDAEIAALVHRTHDAVGRYRDRFNIKKGKKLPVPTEFTLHDKCGAQAICIEPVEREDGEGKPYTRLAVFCPAGTTEQAIAEAFADSEYCDYYQQWKEKHDK